MILVFIKLVYMDLVAKGTVIEWGKLSSVKVFRALPLFLDYVKQNIIQPPEYSETSKLAICSRLRML